MSGCLQNYEESTVQVVFGNNMEEKRAIRNWNIFLNILLDNDSIRSSW